MPAAQIPNAGLVHGQKLVKHLVKAQGSLGFAGFGLGKGAQQNTRAILEFPGVAQMRHHAVHPIGFLAHLVQAQNLAPRVNFPGRAP